MYHGQEAIKAQKQPGNFSGIVPAAVTLLYLFKI